MEFRNLETTEEAARFKKHLDLEENERIVFSGIFGIGKTYFIDRFFGQFSSDYIPIRLNPVNYSVSRNEDIFELIKFDIAYQLLSKDIDFEKLEFDTKQFSEYYLVKNYSTIIGEMASSLSKIDQRVDAIVSSTLALGKKMKEEQKETEIDDKAQMEEFMNSFYRHEGSIREENDITILINHLIEGLREKHPTKKIVLVIDDLDRIDPEHIFRILNVFSVHFDFFGDSKKFDVDKVILICDVDNIRGIFHNKYGTGIDFTGYIDKFFSTDIFYYQFRGVLANNIQKFLRSITLDDQSVQEQLRSKETHQYVRDELSFILGYLILSNGINTRVMVNFLKTTHSIETYSIKVGYTPKVSSKSTPILLVLDILTKIMGGEDNLLSAIDRIITQFPVVEFQTYGTWLDWRIGNPVMLIDHQQHNFSSRPMGKYEDRELDIEVLYKVDFFPGDHSLVGKVLKVGSFGSDLRYDPGNYHPSDQLAKDKIPYFQLLKKAFIAQREFPKEKY